MEQHTFKKQFGQNFLKSDIWAKLLAASAKINSNDTVIEIGAGHGIVTRELANNAKRVLALDIDPSLMTYLQKKFAQDTNVEILNEDILTWNFTAALDPQGKKTANKFKVVSSLPYNVAKKILRIFLTLENPPQMISVIIQKEVADNYLAEAPKATFLANFARCYADVEFVEDIPPEAFFPQPKVDSAIIAFKPHKPLVSEPEKLLALIKAGFASPRKTLVNNLSSYLHRSKAELAVVLIMAKINEKSRPENLSLQDWIKIYNKLPTKQ
jgi:16S rRNA (adenine1518-N6/adenine1519-N6)-dimethyltransferase